MTRRLEGAAPLSLKSNAGNADLSQVISIHRSRRRGVALLVSVAVIALLFGFVGLAVDTAHLLDTRTRLQSAADMAALAAATRGEAGAREFAGLNGFPQAEVNVVIQAGTAEVELRTEAPVFFMKAFGRSAFEARARAVARRGELVE